MISRWLGDEVAKQRGGPRADPEEQAFAVFPEVRNLLARRGLHLSGGQRKMVAIARAMMLSPYAAAAGRSVRGTGAGHRQPLHRGGSEDQGDGRFTS